MAFSVDDEVVRAFSHLSVMAGPFARGARRACHFLDALQARLQIGVGLWRLLRMQASSSSADEVALAPTENADHHLRATEWSIGEADQTRRSVLVALTGHAGKPRGWNI